MNLIEIIKMRFSACIYYTKRSSIQTIIMHSQGTYTSYHGMDSNFHSDSYFVITDKDNCQTKIQFVFLSFLFDFLVIAFMNRVKIGMRK